MSEQHLKGGAYLPFVLLDQQCIEAFPDLIFKLALASRVPDRHFWPHARLWLLSLRDGLFHRMDGSPASLARAEVPSTAGDTSSRRTALPVLVDGRRRQAVGRA